MTNTALHVCIAAASFRSRKHNLRHLRAIILLPFVVAVVIPTYILYTAKAISVGWLLAFPINFLIVLGGVLLICIGLVLMFQTVSLFASIGKGTLAPWEPTQKLVAQGVYRHVRNPMISGVFGILFGETILFGSIPLLYWSVVFVLVNMMYIPLIEEAGLEARFGEDYREYKKNVPRWIPRFNPWETK